MQEKTIHDNQIKETAADALSQARKTALKQTKQLPLGNFDWLNENSRKFLGAGYLIEGVTAEERIREVG